MVAMMLSYLTFCLIKRLVLWVYTKSISRIWNWCESTLVDVCWDFRAWWLQSIPGGHCGYYCRIPKGRRHSATDRPYRQWRWTVFYLVLKTILTFSSCRRWICLPGPIFTPVSCRFSDWLSVRESSLLVHFLVDLIARHWKWIPVNISCQPARAKDCRSPCRHGGEWC